MCPSSTSSSEPAPSARDYTRALLLAAMVLLVVEIGIARQDWWWTACPSAPSGALEIAERLLIQPCRHPVIVIMGSSRQRAALLPEQLEDGLGLPRGSVINVSLPMGTPFDALTLYRRNRDKLSHARLIITGLDDWDCNGSLALNDRDRRFASLQDRLQLYDRAAVPSLLIGWAWRTYDANGPVKSFIRDYLLSGRRRPPIVDHGRIDWERIKRPERGPAEMDASADVEGFYWQFKLGQARLKQLDRLIALTREDGVEVMVFRPPMRRAYVRSARALHPEAYAQVIRVIRSVRGARIVVYEAGDEVGLAETDFEDYGHILDSGARKMTDHLVAVLRAEGFAGQGHDR